MLALSCISVHGWYDQRIGFFLFQELESFGMLQKIKFTLLILAIAFTLIVALQNTGPTDIEILFYSLNLPKTVLIMAAVAAGFLVGALMTSRMLRRKQAKPAKPAKAPPAASSKT